jgi:hypothetical protein
MARVRCGNSDRAFDQGFIEKASQITSELGVHPDALACRYDQMGLVPLIGGGEVVSITDRRATIRTPGCSRLIYTCSPKQGAEGAVLLVGIGLLSGASGPTNGKSQGRMPAFCGSLIMTSRSPDE